MRRTRSLHVVALAAGATLLTACGGAPEASPAPTRTPSQSQSVDRPPTIPAQAAEQTQDGAEAATQAFLSALNYAGRTGDTGPFRSTFIDFCTRCEAIADGVDETYGDGGEIEGGEWDAQDTKFYGINDGVAVLDVVVNYSEQIWKRDAQSQPVKIDAKTNVLKAFNLRFENGLGWRVSALDPEA